MQAELTSLVQRATSRSVIAYMSQVHHDPDLAVELFVLEPRAEPAVAEGEGELPHTDEAI